MVGDFVIVLLELFEVDNVIEIIGMWYGEKKVEILLMREEYV